MIIHPTTVRLLVSPTSGPPLSPFYSSGNGRLTPGKCQPIIMYGAYSCVMQERATSRTTHAFSLTLSLSVGTLFISTSTSIYIYIPSMLRRLQSARWKCWDAAHSQWLLKEWQQHEEMLSEQSMLQSPACN